MMATAVDTVLYVRIFVEGLMAFAAVHYLIQWWWSKQETTLLGFSILCAMVAVLNHAMASVAMAQTIADAQAAMDLRTTVGLLAYPLLAWLVSRVGGVAADRFVRTVSAVLGSA